MIRWGAVSVVTLVALAGVSACKGGGSTVLERPEAGADSGGPLADAGSSVEAGSDVDAGPCDLSTPSCRDYGDTPAPAGPRCGGRQLCDLTSFTKSDGTNLDEKPELVTGAKCMLQAYRDGTVGYFQWSIQNSFDSGSSQVVEIRAGRVSIDTANSTYDLLQQGQVWADQPLKDPSFFTDCLTKTTVKDLFPCVQQAFPSECK